jgi:protein-tyrosine phosphatase
MMYLIELPFGFPGRIFGSPMPFGDFDPEGGAFREFKREKISVIVLLAEEEECFQKTGLNLRAFYSKKGFQVIHLPIPDFSVPSTKDLERTIKAALQHAQAGHNIVIHCHAGIGRTGLFAACLAKAALGLSGEEAIGWIKNYIPGAGETRSQRELILDDGTLRHSPLSTGGFNIS